MWLINRLRILGAGVGTAATAGYFTFFSRGSRATDAHSRKDSLIGAKGRNLPF